MGYLSGGKAKVVTRLAVWCLIMLLAGGFTACQVSPGETTWARAPAVGGAMAPMGDQEWRAPQPQRRAPLLPSISDVVDMAEHSVVAVSVDTVSYDILNRPSRQSAAGSGWVIDEKGIIVTNNHVVEGAEKVTVALQDGRTFTASDIHTDHVTDLAILRIDAGKLPAAKVGDMGRVRVGDWVVVIGNPLGLGISAKEGIVSRLGVPVSIAPGQTLHNLIETSAAINLGNSGGPLINMAGEVIGITSAKIGTVGVEGMGYAINIRDALPIIEDLVKSGCIIRPWLGVDSLTVDRGASLRLRLSVDAGAVVTEVAPGSPAERAGLKAGDVIVGFQGRNITSAPELAQAERASEIGQVVTITFWRSSTKSTVEVQLQESPPCVYRK